MLFQHTVVVFVAIRNKVVTTVNSPFRYFLIFSSLVMLVYDEYPYFKHSLNVSKFRSNFNEIDKYLDHISKTQSGCQYLHPSFVMKYR